MHPSLYWKPLRFKECYTKKFNKEKTKCTNMTAAGFWRIRACFYLWKIKKNLPVHICMTYLQPETTWRTTKTIKTARSMIQKRELIWIAVVRFFLNTVILFCVGGCHVGTSLGENVDFFNNTPTFACLCFRIWPGIRLKMNISTIFNVKKMQNQIVLFNNWIDECTNLIMSRETWELIGVSV